MKHDWNMINAEICVRDYLDHQVSDYSFLEKYIISPSEPFEDGKYFHVDFTETKHDVLLRVSNIEEDNDEDCGFLYDIEVDMYEDAWEDCRYYDWNTKYFWMALRTRGQA